MISLIVPIYDPNDSLVPAQVLPRLVEKVKRLEGENELILVNNSPKSQRLNLYLNELVAINGSWCKKIVCPENLGVSRGFNAGLTLASATSTIFVFMSTDADIVDFKMLTKIERAFTNDVTLGIAHPYSAFEDVDTYNINRQLSYRSFKQAVKSGSKALEVEPSEDALSEIVRSLENAEQTVLSPIKSFPMTFAAISKELILNIGSFDNRFLFGCHENNDLAFRSLKAGYKVGRLNNIFVNHKRFTVRELTVKTDKELKQLPHGAAVAQAGEWWLEKYRKNYDEIYFEFRYGYFLFKVFYLYFLAIRVVRKLILKRRVSMS